MNSTSFRDYPGSSWRWATIGSDQGVAQLLSPWYRWSYWCSIKLSRHLSGT